MPCGGIYPMGRTGHRCEQCGGPEPDHFCDEWDCELHGRCIVPYLRTHEGTVVLDHKHTVIIDLGEGIVCGSIAAWRDEDGS